MKHHSTEIVESRIYIKGHASDDSLYNLVDGFQCDRVLDLVNKLHKKHWPQSKGQGWPEVESTRLLVKSRVPWRQGTMVAGYHGGRVPWRQGL